MNKYKSLLEVQEQLKITSLTCVKLVDYFLTRIEEASGLNAFVEVFEESALKRAGEIDLKIKRLPHPIILFLIHFNCPL